MMSMKKRQMYQKKMLPVYGGLMRSLTIALWILVLSFTSGPQMAHAQEDSSTKKSITENATGEMTSESSDDVVLPSCTVSPIVVPTLPDKIPGYTQLDPDTQLHVTGTAQVIELESYRLEITGKVKHPLRLAYDDLRCMPKIEARPTLVCPGFFEDTASWAGVPLQYLLKLAGVEEDAERIRLMSADGYATSVTMEVALSDENFLAYEWEGEPIPILHGFPVRAVFPELQGNKWIKWLVKIEVQ